MYLSHLFQLSRSFSTFYHPSWCIAQVSVAITCTVIEAGHVLPEKSFTVLQPLDPVASEVIFGDSTAKQDCLNA